MVEAAIIGAAWGFVGWFVLNCIVAVYEQGTGNPANATSAMWFGLFGAAVAVVLS